MTHTSLLISDSVITNTEDTHMHTFAHIHLHRLVNVHFHSLTHTHTQACIHFHIVSHPSSHLKSPCFVSLTHTFRCLRHSCHAGYLTSAALRSLQESSVGSVQNAAVISFWYWYLRYYCNDQTHTDTRAQANKFSSSLSHARSLSFFSLSLFLSPPLVLTLFFSALFFFFFSLYPPWWTSATHTSVLCGEELQTRGCPKNC